MQVKIKMYDPEREFNGILVEAQWTGSSRMTITPIGWSSGRGCGCFGRTTDCRIFQDKTAPDIIKEVFNDRGFTDYKSELHEEGSCPKLEYCVQYRETDLNFVSRLMEQHGIYYFFKHEGGKHTLVLADSKSSHSARTGSRPRFRCARRPASSKVTNSTSPDGLANAASGPARSNSTITITKSPTRKC